MNPYLNEDELRSLYASAVHSFGFKFSKEYVSSNMHRVLMKYDVWFPFLAYKWIVEDCPIEDTLNYLDSKE